MSRDSEVSRKESMSRHLDAAKVLCIALRDAFPPGSEKWRWYDTELSRINVARWGV